MLKESAHTGLNNLSAMFLALKYILVQEETLIYSYVFEKLGSTSLFLYSTVLSLSGSNL